jgi:quercetin dioxygenase-like cupin family protein
MAAAGYTLVHLDDFERPFPHWALARRSLGLSSFGMNVVELEPGGSIPAHDETARDQEEVFVTLSGTATLVIDGVPHPAPAGTFCRLDPGPERYARNDGDTRATLLVVSAPRTSGYEPLEWA